MTVRGVLIDLSGVLYVGNDPVPGAREALQRLRDADLPLCFVTNTTRRTRQAIVGDLDKLGFGIAADEIMTAALAARALVERESLSPYLLIHPNLEPDFAGMHSDKPDCLLIGDLGEGFTYERLNAAFRAVTDRDSSPRLIAMAVNRYFSESDGLSLDMGPFVKALEYALEVEAEVTGKPAAGFFRAALDVIGCKPEEAIMIGDDAENDVAGANAAGIPGILVKTGKYQQDDEARLDARWSSVCDDFGAAVERLLSGPV